MNDMKNRIESKLFNGYVIEPIPMVVLTCFVGMCLLGLLLWGIWDTHHSDDYEIKEAMCTIVSYECDGPVYVIETNQNLRFDLPSGAFENELLDHVIYTNAPVRIKYKCVNTQKRNSYDAVEIRDNKNNLLVTQDTINKINSQNGRRALIVLCSVCLVYWTLVIGGYYILCNAPKYPRLASILIRKPFRNF